MRNEEIERLNAAKKQTSDKRLYGRYLAVRLRLEGHICDEIGELLSRLVKPSTSIGKPTKRKVCLA